MNPYLRFLKVVLLHKWYVLVAGCRLRVPFWRLVVHDLSRFSFTEFREYARWFYGDKKNADGFDRAWVHHQNHNDHHPEYWIDRSNGGNEPLPMPIVQVREMVADWFAAGKAYHGHWPNPCNFTWFEKNRDHMRLHEDTEMRISFVLTRAAQWRWL